MIALMFCIAVLRLLVGLPIAFWLLHEVLLRLNATASMFVLFWVCLAIMVLNEIVTIIVTVIDEH